MALQGIYTAKYDTLINVPMAIPYALSASIVPSLTAVVTAGTQKQVHYKIDQTIRSYHVSDDSMRCRIYCTGVSADGAAV